MNAASAASGRIQFGVYSTGMSSILVILNSLHNFDAFYTKEFQKTRLFTFAYSRRLPPIERRDRHGPLDARVALPPDRNGAGFRHWMARCISCPSRFSPADGYLSRHRHRTDISLGNMTLHRG